MQLEPGASKREFSRLRQSLRLVVAAACLWPALAAAQTWNPTGSDANRNTAAGKDALLNVTTGHDNTAMGYFALTNTTTGRSNSGSGAWTLHYNTTGDYNTASGYAALNNNTSGSYNTATGQSALNDNSTGNWNTADGYKALFYNRGGGFNTASGYQALFSNTNGGYNTGIGKEALFKNTTGGYNTGFGAEALYSNALGLYNTVVGAKALRKVTQSTSNVAVGYSALSGLAGTSSSNIALGTNAGYLTRGGNNNIYIGSLGIEATESNVTRIGRTTTKVFVKGIADVPLSGAHVVINSAGQLGVVASSARYKEDISPLGDVSEQLSQLRPVSFSYKAEPGATHYGLIAEEVDQVMPELVVRDEQDRPESVQYLELIPLLLQERQEIKAQLDRQQAELERERALNEQQAETLAELRHILDTHFAADDTRGASLELNN